MPSLTRTQILALAGFLLILVSIPLTFTLVKRSQTFKSKASEVRDLPEIEGSASAKLREVPSTSPLTELQKLLETSKEEEGQPTPTPIPAANLAFGPTMTIKINIEGRPQNNQAAKVFIGLSAGAATTKPKYVLSFTVDIPASGIFSGLSLAGLNPGSTYTAYLKGPGQIDTASTFVMGPTESQLNNNLPVLLLSGDLNEDNTINSADYTIAKSLYRSTFSSSNWNERADFNLDKVINNMDLVYITRNFGKTGASGTWYSPIPTATSSATRSGTPAIGGYESSGGYWIWVP